MTEHNVLLKYVSMKFLQPLGAKQRTLTHENHLSLRYTSVNINVLDLIVVIE